MCKETRLAADCRCQLETGHRKFEESTVASFLDESQGGCEKRGGKGNKCSGEEEGRAHSW